ncbi:carboxypeptidase-like regulatory domain-containing protein [Flavobacterium sp. J27]|uniref:carboxypeptidase-like regulatory domain-containing protein n=1 Tax=Flavobacterium sp. J27 TaxID=2060419 RepID=UPI00102FA790|nr:carboxypeptidase-like regulatory domain-containing protein [Flavobacterium sp. J27]
MLIQGKITDFAGEPIHMATVSIKDSNPLIGVSTDFDGNYAINAQSGQVLEFSYVGNVPVQRVVNSYNNIINVTMANEIALPEVTVTGKKPTNYWTLFLELLLVGFIIKSVVDINKQEKEEKKPKPKKITI